MHALALHLVRTTFRLRSVRELVSFEAQLNGTSNIANRPLRGSLWLNVCGDQSFRDVAGQGSGLHRSVSGKEEKEMLKAFLNYGLVAAVLVWAGVVALMAYRLDDSPWRWAFAALAVGGIVTVVAIFKIRRYIDGLNKAPEQQGKP